MKRTSLLLLLLVPVPCVAQSSAPAAGPAVEAGRVLYQQVSDYLIRSAEQMPEADYGFRPAAEVRSFGELIGHVANAQYAICAAAMGEESPSAENIERDRTTKAALVEALRASAAYCDRAYQQTDEEALRPTSLFGQQRSRLAALNLNTVHGWEHYGNLVTYLRIRGMVPPSSQPRQ